MHDGSITIFCKNQLSEMERLQQMISRFCDLHGVGARFQHAFVLATDEMITNIIRHGFEDDGPHQIRVQINLAGDQLSAEIEDDGREFNPVEFPVVNCGKPLEERQPGGLGIHLVRSLMSRLEYRREGGKNFLTLFQRVH